MKISILLVVTTLIGLISCEKKIICYHGTWSTYRPGNGQFNVEHINPFLCTHLIYAFLGISGDGTLKILDSYLDLEENWGRGNIKKFNDLKKMNPNLKTIVGVGGWNEGSVTFSMVASDPSKRIKFALDVVNFCLTHKFDGVDIDWEYPAQRGGNTLNDKENHILLLKELSSNLIPHKLTLSAGVAATKSSAHISYDIPNISNYLDFINIMSYDLHGSWDTTLGYNSPLYKGTNDVTDAEMQLNVESCIQYWLDQGAPKGKLMLGVPLYGRTFRLRDITQTNVGDFNSGPGEPAKYTREPGVIGYNEVCEQQTPDKWIRNWDPIQKVPFTFYGNQWISYDDPESIGLKADYVNQLELGGIMVWSIETDDFHGICNNGKFPLLQKINSILRDDYVAEVTDTTTTTTTITTPTFVNTSSSEHSTGSSTTTTTKLPNPENPCTIDGIFRDPDDCSAFYICDDFISYDFVCPTGLLFDTNVLTCNWPDLVVC